MLENDKLEAIPDEVLPSDVAFETPSAAEPPRRTKPPGPRLFEALLWCLGMQGAHLIGWIMTFVGIIAYVLVSRGAQVADQDVIKKLLDDIPKSYLFQLISGEMFVFVAIATVACWWRIGRPFTRRIGLTQIPSKQLVLMLAGTVPLMVFCGGLHQVCSELWKELAELVPPFQVFKGLDTNENLKEFGVGVPLWALVLVIAVAPAIGEEIIFRGVLSRGLIARYGIGVGVAITSVLFAAVHLHPAHAAAVLPLGIYIHVCYLSSRSFTAPVLVHFLNNAIAAVMLTVAPMIAEGQKKLGDAPDEKSVPVLAMLITGVIAFLTITAIFRCRVRYIVPGQGEWSPGYPSVEVPPEDVGAVLVADQCHPVFYYVVLFLGMFATSTLIFGIGEAAKQIDAEPEPVPAVSALSGSGLQRVSVLGVPH